MKRLILLACLLLLLPVPSWAAISFGSQGAANTNTASAAPGYPNPAQGDLLIMCVVNKYMAQTAATPSGWTAASSSGTGDPGNGPGIDVGSMRATIFTKIASGAEGTGTVTVTVTSANAVLAVIARYTNASGTAGLWDIAGATGGGDDTHGTSWSATLGSDPGVTSGDVLFVCSGRNTDTGTASVEALTQTGITFGTETERSDSGTTTGDDIGFVTSDHAVTSGTSSAAPVYTFTNSTSTAGGTALLRMREVAGGTVLQSGQGFLGGILK